MPSAHAALVILARAPEIGRVKSRLAASIGDAGALHVYRQLLTHVAQVQAAWCGPILLTTTGDDQTWNETSLRDVPRQPQTPGDLGRRIAAALEWGLDHAQVAVVIGTDCPGLQPIHLERLARLAHTAPVAFGPAEDGGYWGIAVANRAVIPLCTNSALPWSTPQLLQTTKRNLAHAQLTWADSDMLADCDDADDLAAAVQAGFLTWPTTVEMRK